MTIHRPENTAPIVDASIDHAKADRAAASAAAEAMAPRLISDISIPAGNDLKTWAQCAELSRTENLKIALPADDQINRQFAEALLASNEQLIGGLRKFVQERMIALGNIKTMGVLTSDTQLT